MNGKPLTEWSLRERARTRAVLPQHSTWQFVFRVLDVVLMGRSAHRKAAFTTDDMNIVRAVLTCTDVPHLEKRLFPSLSGGERQRVQLARVLAQIWDTDLESPRYLLLDEPTSSLDLSHQHSTLWIARKLADDKGVGMLVVLHDLNLAALYADRIAIMQDGQLKSLGHPAEVLQAPILEEVFGIPVIICPHAARQDRPLVVTSPAIHRSSIFWDTR